MTNEYKKQWRNNLKKLGLCAKCPSDSRNRTKDGKTCCDECAKHSLELMKKKKLLRKSNALCVLCGQPAKSNRTMCEACCYKNNERLNKSRAIRRQNGMCEVCNLPQIKYRNKTTSYCRKCYLKRLSKSRLGATKYWQELNKIFDKQIYCPYTGNQLMLGVNASLDHKMPICRGGTNDIDNLQFVYNNEFFDVNLMKGAMTDDEFKKAIVLIYNKIINF